MNVVRGFKCDHTYHLRLYGATALAIYDKIGALTYDTTLGLGTYNSFYTSGRKLAEFYDSDENFVTKILRKLADEGWLRRVGYGPGTVFLEDGGVYRQVKKNIYKPKNYQYVTHVEWAAEHTSKCFVREEMVWDQEEHDKLAQTLHNISFGMTFWYPEMLAGLRASGKSDHEIALAFDDHVKKLQVKPNGKQGWKKVALAFTAAMAGQL
jgi:hypothetical protein